MIRTVIQWIRANPHCWWALVLFYLIAVYILPEKLKLRVAQVRESLRRTAAGEMILPGAAENGRGAGFSTIAGDEPVFSRETLRGY